MKAAIHNIAPPTELERKVAEALSPLINAVLGHPQGKATNRPGVLNKFRLPESDDAEIAEIANAGRQPVKPDTDAGKGKFLLPEGD